MSLADDFPIEVALLEGLLGPGKLYHPAGGPGIKWRDGQMAVIHLPNGWHRTDLHDKIAPGDWVICASDYKTHGSFGAIFACISNPEWMIHHGFGTKEELP